MPYLVETTKKFEQMKSPNWEESVGQPTKWMLWNGNRIKFVPGVTSASYCQVGYVQMPDLFTSTGATATVDARIPPTHNEYLKYAAAYFLLNMRGERQFVDLADKFMAEFRKLIGA